MLRATDSPCLYGLHRAILVFLFTSKICDFSNSEIWNCNNSESLYMWQMHLYLNALLHSYYVSALLKWAWEVIICFPRLSNFSSSGKTFSSAPFSFYPHSLFILVLWWLDNQIRKGGMDKETLTFPPLQQES